MAVAFCDVDEISTILFRRQATLNPNFEVPTYLQRFEALRSIADKVNFVYKDLKKYKLFPKPPNVGKRDSDAIEIRENGNEMFVGGLYRTALCLYSRSIATAKSPIVASMAYANRSACLYKLGKYQECLTDIERAIAHNYPENLKPKLIDRRKNAEKMVKPTEPYYEPIPEIPESRKHSLIQCAKNSIAIQVNDEFGRHVVAQNKIKIGEIICVESPYTHTLFDTRELHCDACLKLCYNQIPCDNCTYCLFCSEDCREKAKNTYHKIECTIIDAISFYEVPCFMLLALRTTLMAADDYHRLDSLQIEPGETYRSDRYKEIHNLMTGLDKTPLNNMFDFAVKAAFVFYFLENTPFFSGPNCDLSKTVFKELFVKHLAVVVLNGYQIYEGVSDMFGSTSQRFAAGLYSFSSLFNHACCRNVEAVQYGSTMVLRAIKPIKKGEQCFISYGPQYESNGIFSRQVFLKKNYFFDCKCEACENHWAPSFDLIPLCVDLRMSNLEVILMMMELSQNRVDAVRRYLPHLTEVWKRHEKFEPMGNTSDMKQLVSKCFKTLGNKFA